MKILHIGDMHIGSKLDDNSRNKEIGKVLDFLVETIKKENIEAVLCAGDVFDNGRPSNESQELYYGFLVHLCMAGCKHVVIIAGNHDNPNFLEAPKELLKHMNIHVVGNVDANNLVKEVITLGTKEAPAAYVCAVPQLNNYSVRDFIPAGESGESRDNAFEAGVREHYRKVYEIADGLRAGRNVPIIGMGHLYVQGGTFSTKNPKRIVGTQKAIEFGDVADGFDYMALGHIHKPQRVSDHSNWWYAGSLIPMTIQENPYATQVMVVDTEDIANPKGIEIPDNCIHRMQYITGDKDELLRQLKELDAKGADVWIKAVYTGKTSEPNWAIDLSMEMQRLNSSVKIVETDINREGDTPPPPGGEEGKIRISELTPLEVFQKHLKRKNDTSEEQRAELEELFKTSMNRVYSPSQKTEQNKKTVAGAMKFKQLYIKNVNSLYGENSINFENEAFNDGVFLISGNTGSGKSSIMDAICLALYGCTPRIKGSTITENTDCIMSDGQNEMMAELTFALGKDVYRATFSHTRKPRAKDKFQKKEHILCKYDDAKNAFVELQLEKPSGKSRDETAVNLKIAELTGLDASQFMRCVLLAQGSFDAFLKSADRERAEILKKITGTEIYSLIAKAIVEDYKKVEADHKYYEDNLTKGDKGLDDEAFAKLTQEHADAQTSLNKIEDDLKKCESDELQCVTIDQQKQRVQEALQTYENAKQAVEEAEPRRKVLEAAKRAQNCQQAYNAWKGKDDERARVQADIANLVNEHITLANTLENAKIEKKNKEDALAQAEKRQVEETRLLQEVRLLDAAISGLKTQIANVEKELNNARETKQTAEKKYNNAVNEWNNRQTQAKESEKYISNHKGDEQLEQKQPNWELRREQLCKDEAAIASEQKKFKNDKDKLEKDKEDLAGLKKKLEESTKSLQGIIDKIASEEKNKEALLNGKTVEELRNTSNAAKKLDEFLKDPNIRKAFLNSSEACPLCGSTNHPYRDEAAVPHGNDYADMASKLDKCLQQIEVIDKTLKEEEKNKADAEKAKAVDETNYNNKEAIINESQESLDNRKANLDTAIKEAAEKASALASELHQTIQVEWTEHSALPEELQKRIEDYKKAKAEIDALGEARVQYDTACAAYNAVKQQNENAVTAQEQALSKLQENLNAKTAERVAKLGDDKVDDRERLLAESVANSRREAETAKANATTAEANLNNNDTTQKNQNNVLTEINTQLSQLQITLNKTVKKFGFADVQDFETHRMEQAQLDELAESLNALTIAMTNAETTLNERKNNLNEEKKKLGKDFNREANTAQIAELNASKQTLNQQIQQLFANIEADRILKENRAELERKLKEIEKLFNNWSYLNNNFGEGERFVRIAQGYTFKELLYHANDNRLASLKNHFTLINDDASPLELNVIDHYRSDRIRTSRNLSGGESFEVSLALALGLAAMSATSQKASLGNVLLDEGFGTLDDDSLDSALDLLMQLNSTDGKLVGIISHVNKLKDKIAARIDVTNSNGMGRLSGAGVATPAEINALKA